MSQENAEIVRRGFEAFVSGDVEAALAAFDPEIVVVVHDLPEVPEYRGLAGLAQWQSDWEESWESWRWEPQEFIPAYDDMVVAVLGVVAKGRSSGVVTERVAAAVVRLRDGKAISLDYYATKADALAAVGLPA